MGCVCGGGGSALVFKLEKFERGRSAETKLKICWGEVIQTLSPNHKQLKQFKSWRWGGGGGRDAGWGGGGGVWGIRTVLHTTQKAKELGGGSYFLPSEYEFQTFGRVPRFQ